MEKGNVVSQEEWLRARVEHLGAEKALSRHRDEVMRRRRALPWVKVDKAYEFEGPEGKLRLLDLFQGNEQLIVYHFMYGPGWEQGCDGCSYLADHFDGARLHLQPNNVTLCAVSRAPLAEFTPFKQRMGWQFPWYSSFGSDFNYDYHVSFSAERIAAGDNSYNFRPRQSTEEGESHGYSVFVRDGDEVYHTYSCYARGNEETIGTHMFMDMTPLGRNETSAMSWLRLHDEYDKPLQQAECCGSQTST